MKISDDTGIETTFDPERLQLWIVRTLNVMPSRAKRIVRQFARDIADAPLVSGQDVQIHVARLALTTSWLPREIAALPTTVGGGILLQSSFSPTDAVGPALSGLSTLIDLLKEQGFVADGADGSFKKESGPGGFFGLPDDATAPRMLVTLTAAGCCDPGKAVSDRIDEPTSSVDDQLDQCPQGTGGICVRAAIVVTDNTGLLSGSDSGVLRIQISNLITGPAGVHQVVSRTVRLNKNERKQTTDGRLPLDIYICVPCESVKDGFLHFSVRAIDDDDNVRLVFASCPAAIQRKKCCGG